MGKGLEFNPSDQLYDPWTVTSPLLVSAPL